ncbi:MAG TPA: hypothetical protein VHS31_17405 [Tepidisphaeraceae bacterium]|nr:hypothetical protein [Tepidisphaeraceae bacterium]
MDIFELPPLFIMLVVVVIMFVIISAAVGKRPGVRGEQRLCRACGVSHPRFARFCRRCGRPL